MVSVFHNKNFIGFSFMTDEAAIKAKAQKIPTEDLMLVAEVHTTELDKAFELTNNITHSWTNNRDVKPFLTECRSTSTGDIMEKNGRRYVVAAVGFVEI